jgi:hypothetical protein
MCVQSQYIPLSVLWDGLNPLGVRKGTFVIVLRGLIDDSGDSKDLFSLACLIADGASWFYLENEWKDQIDRKNASLIAQGRSPISRYHAADCSSLVGEFADWTKEEQRDFSIPLLRMFHTYATHGYSLTVSLREMEEVIPDISPNPEGFAWVILFHLLMMWMCNNTLTIYPDAIISLIHDRTKYAAVLQEAFRQIVDDPNFRCRSKFTALVPMTWEQCIALQPADLFAYESFKADVAVEPRKSLKLLLAEGSKFGGRAGRLNKDALMELRKSYEALDESTKAVLLATARVSTKKGKNKSS